MKRITPHRSPGVFAFVAFVAVLSNSDFVRPRTHAQSPPPAGGFVELATSSDVRPMLSAGDLSALLPARGTFTFPLPYGTTGVRLTNAADCSGSDCVSPVGPATWSKISNSAGSTYLYVVLGLDSSNGGQGPTLFRFNKANGETLNLGPLFAAGDDLTQSDASGWYFSGTQGTMLYVPIDRELRRYNVLTHTPSVVFDITTQFGDDKEVWEAHSSADDRMHSFTLRSATNYEPLGCGVYREDTQQFSYFPAQGTFEGCQVDKSGHWLLIKEDADNGVNGIDNRIVDLTFGGSTVLLDAQGAGGSADLGFGTMLAADDHNALPNAIRRWAFGPLAAGPVVYRDLAGQPSTFTSISFANARSAGLDEQFACGSAVNRTNGPRANEIVCAKLDGSLSTLVVAPVMTDLDAAGGGDDDAAKAPRGTLDPTGEYYLWTSNAMGGRLDAFLVQVPSELLVTSPGDASAPTVAITAPAQSATVFSSVPLSATAADDIGVAGVRFKIDGVNLGAEITSAPFAWTWNTATTTDGVHVLTAVARDAAGNTTISVPISVTVHNTPGAPSISGVNASSIKQTRALIGWTTNQLADSQVEYGLTTSYGGATTLDTSLQSSHMQLLTALSPGTTYHYRVISRNAQNEVATSGDFTFTTAAPLLISNIGPTYLSGTAVTLGWTTNQAASTQIEYGLTTAYGDATEFDETAVTTHAQSLSGFTPATTYHFRVYSVTPAGALAVSADQTFTTLSAPGGGGPAAPGGFVELATATDTRALLGAAALQALLPSRGEFTMPAPYATKAIRLTNGTDCGGTSTDCVFAMGGAAWRHLNNSTGSDLLYAVIGLDLNNGGAGPSVFRYNKITGETANLGPLFSPSNDLALQTSAGWYFSATAPTMLYVHLDRELRRVDILSHTSSVVLDVTGVFGSDKEITNVYSSSDDRVHSFTVRLATTGAAQGCGVYREDAQQYSFYPSLGGFQECGVDKSGHWLLVKDGTDSRIVNLDLGTVTTIANSQPAGAHSDMGFGSMLMVDGTQAQPNSIRRFGFGPLTSGPVVYQDLAGQPQSFTHISFANARSAPLDQQYACGSAVNRTNGPRANEIVCVKLDGSLSTLVVAPVMTDLDATGGGDDDAAKQPFANLDPTGEYILWTSNAMGSRLDAFLVRVPSQLLVTPPADTTSPTVAIATPGQQTTVSGTTAIGASAADYSGVAGVQFKLDGVNLGAEVTSAPFTISWNTTLVGDGIHVLTAVARDAAGNTAVSGAVNVTVLNTATAPLISDVTVYGITQSTALISWKTNQSADTQVEYGPTTSYGASTPLNSQLTNHHFQLLTGLTSGTTYHYRMTSRNAQLLATTSGDFTFSTAVALAIANVVPSSVTSTTATISWQTNLFATSQVEYGLTTSYGDATDLIGTFVMAHAIPLGASLQPGTTYHYRVYSATGNGSMAVSGDYTFTTPSNPGTGPAPGGIVELATSTQTRAFLTAGEIQAVLPTRGAFTMPAPYGTTAVRVTNGVDCAGTDCVRKPGGANWRNMSNSAGSNVMYVVLVLDRMAGGSGATLFSYNKSTGETANLGPLFDSGDELTWSDGAGWYFSATQPTSYYVSVDRQFRRYDVLTHASTVVFDVTAQFGADKEIAQVHSSNDDRVHSFTLRSAANGTGLGCGVYREDTQQYAFHPALGTLRECQVDKSGRWLLVSEGTTGDQNRIIDLVLGGSTTVPNSQASDGDVDMGFGAMIARDTAALVPNPLRTWTFGPLTPGPVVYQDPTTAARSVQYLSFGNARSAPLGQQFACGSALNHTLGPRANEIACFRLDGSLATLVVAPVMTNLNTAGGVDDAGKRPNGNLDPTGEYFLWTSNAMGDRLDAFVVRVPSQLLVTPPSDTISPAISITAPAATATVSGTVLLSATASDAVGVAGVQFRLDGVNLGAEVTSAPFAWNWNTATTSDGAHTLMAVARDAAGNTAWAVPVSVTVLNTPAAPIISGISASSITNTSALITWSTNQLADSQIQYGLTTAYGSTTSLDATLATSHMQLLGGLTAGTTYHYRVVSKNAPGTTATSADQTFATVSAPVISGVGTSVVNDVSALVSWTTNIAASSQVEYGLTTAYGDSTAFNGSLVTSHGMTISGLVTGTTYHYRVYSVSGAGVTSISGDFTVTTATYPVISNVIATQVSGISATIRWTTDQAANSQVEYGLTTAYGSTTALDPALVTTHARSLTGLTQGTTYHYRVLSRTAAGLLTASPDLTITTPAPTGSPAPVVWTNLVKAAVNGSLLHSTSTCNCGDSGASSVQYISGGDGYVEFPKTSASEIVVGLGYIDSDTSGGTIPFSIWVGTTYLEVREMGVYKWDRPVAINDVLRIAVVGGQVQYSQNGVVFYTSAVAPTYPLLVDAALLNNNSAVSEAVMLGDSLFATPTVISNVATSGITGAAATVTWQTDMAATSRVEYGLTSAYGSLTPVAPALLSQHTVLVTGLTPATTYHYRVISTNTAGATSISGDFTFTTAFAPTFANVGVTLLTSTIAKIAWTTDQTATTQVEYGLTTSYGSTTTANPALVTSHQQTVTGLTPGQTYHYRVVSVSSLGVLGMSADFTFVTPALPGGPVPVVWTNKVNSSSTATVLSNTSLCGCADSGASSLQYISSGNGYVEFKITSLSQIYMVGLGNVDNDTNPNSIPFGILVQGSILEVRELGAYKWDRPLAINDVLRVAVVGGAVKYSQNGVEFYTSAAAPAYPLLADVSLISTGATVTNGTFLGDAVTTPPAVSSVAASGVTFTNATITWTTDQLSTSRVEYGFTTAYGSSTTLDPAMVTSHSVGLSGLQAGQTYHYRVISVNAEGVMTVSADFTFVAEPE